MKLSSTRLQTYFTCPARWYYQYIEGDGGVEPNEAMAIGTVFHAIQEYRVEHGFFPSRHDILRMEGNYEPPSAAINGFPDAWPTAERMARKVGLPDEVPDADVEVEVALEDLGLQIHGVPVTGYFDLLHRPSQHILDWKTRSRMDYAPRTLEDFMAKAQPLYYPAAARKAFGWDHVRFTHLNVLRPGGVYRPVTVTFPAHILDTFWEHLVDTIVPDMLRMVDGGEKATDETACWMYGARCPHWDPCQTPNLSTSFFELGDIVDIVSDEAPPNIEPVPYAEKTVDELGLNRRQAENARKAGLYTLEDVDAWLAEGHTFDEIPYIGSKTADTINQTLESLRASR